jgi:hypothetical protein
MIDRREFLKRAAFTTAGVAFAGVAEASVLARPGWADVGAAGTGDTFGASVQTVGGQSQMDALLALENIAGRTFDTVHNRMPWESSLVNKYSEFIASRGQVPILSWFTRGRVNIKWADLAAGSQDARIAAEASSLKAAGWPAYFCFHKEPENEPWLGNANEWKAAHQRVWSIFQEVGVTNVTFVACFMAPTFKGSFGGINAWLPENYDVIGVDGYNRNLSRNWRTFEKIFTPAHNVATAMGRKLFMIEFGCVEGSPGQKAQWFADAETLLRTWPEVIGTSYNHEVGHSGNDANMNYRVDTSPSAVDGFRAMGGSTFFNPSETFYSVQQPPTFTRTQAPTSEPFDRGRHRRHRYHGNAERRHLLRVRHRRQVRRRHQRAA